MSARTYTVHNAEAGSKLVDFLAAKEQCSLRKAKTLLDERCIFVNHKRVWMARHTLKTADQIEIRTPAAKTATVLPMLYESDHYLVINKPPQLLSNGPDSVETLARRQTSATGLLAVHRLDRDTSGCLLLAKNKSAFDAAVQWFREQRVKKLYQAIVLGRVSSERTRIDRPLDGQTALSHIEVLSANEQASHIRVRIDTGRTHQIRKHLSGIRHPVLGDRQYLTSRMDLPALRDIPRQMLHAYALEAPLAKSEAILRVSAPLPADFKRTLNAFGL